MNKKSQQTWISAVLYIALGMVVLSIILAAGMPVVNKLKDKQISAQTKNIMHEIDGVINSIYDQGPGAQQTRTIDIGKGEFTISSDLDMIQWTLDTKFVESTPGISVKEGNLEILTEATPVVGNYNLILTLYYSSEFDIVVLTQSKVFKGRTPLIFRNAGPSENKIKIEISEV